MGADVGEGGFGFVEFAMGARLVLDFGGVIHGFDVGDCSFGCRDVFGHRLLARMLVLVFGLAVLLVNGVQCTLMIRKNREI